MSEYSPFLDQSHDLQFPARVRALDGKDQRKTNEDQRVGHNVDLKVRRSDDLERRTLET